MPLPSPQGKQDKDSYISSCMGNSTMKGEFPRQSQRHAICQSKWKKAKQSNGTLLWDDDDIDNAQYIIY